MEISDIASEDMQNYDSGTNSYIYRLPQKKIVKFIKIFYTLRETLDILNTENLISKRLYEEGISVPRPEGNFLLNTPLDKTFEYNPKPMTYNDKLYAFPFLESQFDLQEKIPGLIMQYIEGTLIYHMRECKEKTYACSLMEIELEKAKKKGFAPRDDGPVNTLWNRKLEKITLIDFATWNINKKIF